MYLYIYIYAYININIYIYINIVKGGDVLVMKAGTCNGILERSCIVWCAACALPNPLEGITLLAGCGAGLMPWGQRAACIIKQVVYESRANGLTRLLGHCFDGTLMPCSFGSLVYAGRKWPGCQGSGWVKFKGLEGHPFAYLVTLYFASICICEV